MANTILDHEIQQLDNLIQTERELSYVKELIKKAIELKPVLALIHERILTLLNAQDLAIYLLDPAYGQLKLFFKTKKFSLAEHIPFNKTSIEGYTACTRAVLNIGNFQKIESLKSSYNHLDIDYSLYDNDGKRINQVLSAPLIYTGKIFGVVEIFNKRDRGGPFFEEEVLLIDIAESIAAQMSERSTFSKTSSSHKKKILVVDEDKTATNDILNMLSPYSDFYSLITATGRKEVEDSLKSFKVHLTIINLGKHSSKNLMIHQFIKKSYPAIPVMLIVDPSDLRLMNDISTMGISGYYSKPFDYNFFENILEIILFKEPLSQFNESVLVPVGHDSIESLAGKIGSTKSMLEMTNVLRDFISEHFEADFSTMFFADIRRGELHSVGIKNKMPGVTRIKINKNTVAGLCAVKKEIVLINNLQDREEIKSIDSALESNSSISETNGTKFSKVIAVPVIDGRIFYGVFLACWYEGKKEPSNAIHLYLNRLSGVITTALLNSKSAKQKLTTKFDPLVKIGLLDEITLKMAFKESNDSNEPIESILLNKYRISKEDVIYSLEDFYRCHYFKFNQSLTVPGDLFINLNKEYLLRELWVPIKKEMGVADVVMYDPNNIIKLDMIKGLLHAKMLNTFVSSADDIDKLIRHCFESIKNTPQVVDSISIEDIIDTEEIEVEEDKDIEEETRESDNIIIRYVNKMLLDAIMRKASDIHIEPDKKNRCTTIRFRIDGDCIPYQTLPFKHQKAVVSRIKIMSNLDITERRKPQDGKIVFKQRGRDTTELRVAIIPSQADVEDVVLRVLAKGNTVPLESLGLLKRNYEEFKKIATMPYGLILVVGPTGSGKTTTLHGVLQYINKPEKKIWTAEDPIEITQDGIRHVQVNPKIGFDFAAAMRAFLRADPDVIMIGEMRDRETAYIAVEAALTGHLVLSTLHTNSSSETITRLIDMGIDPLVFGESMLGILAQRLVKVLCPRCKVPYNPTEEEYEIIAERYGRQHFDMLGIRYDGNLTLYRPVGCDACNSTGFKGRMGLHELLINSDEIKGAIIRHAKAAEIHELAVSKGMTTLLQDGIIKVFQGITDFQQVIRVCAR